MLLLAALLCGVAGRCTPAPGGATPAEVLARFDLALRAGDREALAQCCSVIDSATPETARQFADMLVMTKVVQPLIIAGVKKYGAATFVKALGTGAIIFNLAATPPPAELLRKRGNLTIIGQTAVYKYQVSKARKEILSPQPELAQFEQAFWGDATLPELTLYFVKSHDRWYLTTPDAKAMAQFRPIYQALKGYCPQVAQALKTCKDGKAFIAALSGANARMSAALIFHQ
jgi:hypothetical protein